MADARKYPKRTYQLTRFHPAAIRLVLDIRTIDIARLSRHWGHNRQPTSLDGYLCNSGTPCSSKLSYIRSATSIHPHSTLFLVFFNFDDKSLGPTWIILMNTGNEKLWKHKKSYAGNPSKKRMHTLVKHLRRPYHSKWRSDEASKWRSLNQPQGTSSASWQGDQDKKIATR